MSCSFVPLPFNSECKNEVKPEVMQPALTKEQQMELLTNGSVTVPMFDAFPERENNQYWPRDSYVTFHLNQEPTITK